MNEQSVLNTRKNKEFFESMEVVPLKADKGVIPDAVEEILTELGNPRTAIPFYAVYGPGLAEPITMDDALITHSMVQNAVKQVAGDQPGSEEVAAAQAAC